MRSRSIIVGLLVSCSLVGAGCTNRARGSDAFYVEAARTDPRRHPYVIGMPFRIKYLEMALDYMCSHEGVWRTTGWEIADWYYKNYYKDPGKFAG